MKLIKHDSTIPIPFLRLIGNATGLTGPLKYEYPDRDEPRIYRTQHSLNNLEEIVPGNSPPNVAGTGKSMRKRQSYAGALGEFVERYSLYWPDESRWIRSTHADLDAGDEAVPLEYLELRDSYDGYTNRTPMTADKDVIWEVGTDLLSGEQIPVPADFVWFSLPDEYQPSFPSTSNGVAYHNSRRDAVERALYEYIERDAFVRTWYSRTSPKQLSLEKFPELQRIKQDRFDTDYVTYYLFEYETGLDLPIVGCAAVDCRDQCPKFVLGSGAAAKYRPAIRDALVEAAQCYLTQKRLHTSEVSFDDIDIKNVRDFDDNITYYSNPDNFEEVSFFLSGETKTPSPTDRPIHGLEAALARLEEAEMTAVAFDTTTPDIRELGGAVARVYVPELVELPPPSLPPRTHPELRSYDVTDRAHPFP